MKRKLRLAASGLSLCLIFAGCGGKNDAINQAGKQDAINGVPVPSLAETKAIAQDGFIFGLPIVMYYTSAYELFVDTTSSQYKAPVGQLINEARVFTYKDTAVITPNSDTPYSLMEIDLRAEPTVISLPAVPKPRYYSVQLTDANTFNYGYMGSRTTGTGPGDYMIVGPDWKGETPRSIKQVFHSTTPFSVVIFRTQLFNAADMPNVVKIQAGYKVQPLSAYLKQPAPAAPPAIDYMKADAEIAKKQFWQVLDFALQYIPPSPEEAAIRAKLASIGIGPGKKFDFKDLSAEHKAAMLLGMKAGDDQVDKYIASGRHSNQRMEGGIILRRPRLLQRRLAQASRRRQGRNFRQQRHRSDVSAHQGSTERRGAGRQQAQLHADLRQGLVAACERILVGDDVRRQDAVPHRQPDQSLSHQLADAARA